MKKILLNAMLGAVLVFVAGCCPPEKAEPPPPAQTNLTPTKTTVKDVLEGITGKTTVDAGLRTKAKVEKIGEEKKKEREEMNKLIGP